MRVKKQYLNDILDDTASGLHLADLCPSNATSYPDPKSAAIYNAFCSAIGGGTRLLFGGACVRNAPADKTYEEGRTADACFPGGASMMLVDPATGRPLKAVAMEDLAIGDAVQCLVPDNMRGAQGGGGGWCGGGVQG